MSGKSFRNATGSSVDQPSILPVWRCLWQKEAGFVFCDARRDIDPRKLAALLSLRFVGNSPSAANALLLRSKGMDAPKPLKRLRLEMTIYDSLKNRRFGFSSFVTY
ncbi:hypothetical protein [Caballeronia sp. LZ001]|uniref:hypothetical protein n=1 Tax=Caballeronia sp. LZ001 TaxID=3038553 RepID=UPI00285AAA33|nr:hypothetical protein [Caballeronia sp. LZ001]MDR5805457.1 hypothetical protein [Caballeronia sp. LZ001]